jgi:uncharacterized protein (TIGR00369 family)
MRQKIEPAQREDYPANIQAILKRVAACSAWIGQELMEIDVEAGWSRVAYEFSEAHFNRFGAVHGGAIACVMDDVLSIAAGLVLQWGEISPTLEMKVSYLGQAAPGRHIGEARVLRRGRQINFLEGTLAREDGKLIASASATLMIAPMQKKS